MTAPPSPLDSSSPLATLQRLMAQAVMRPLTKDDRTQKTWVDGASSADVFAKFVAPNDRLTSFERLEIYNRQYWFRLLDCLHEDYPGLRALLGDTRFHRLSIAYLERHPSTSHALRDLGRSLPEFIAKNPNLTSPHQAIALEMARLEWAQVIAFDGASLPAGNLARLAALPPDKIRFRLQPYITLLDLSYPVDEILIRALRRDGRLRAEASHAVASRAPARRRGIAGGISPRPTRLLVHRFENIVYFKRLESAPFALLGRLAAGETLAAALAHSSTGSAVPAPDDVRAWFQNWTQLGLLAAGREPTRANGRGNRASSRRPRS